MDWESLLRAELEPAYASSARLMKLARDLPLDWKPARENNWMTLGQLLKHLSEACGAPIHGFVSGDWGMPVEAMTPEAMLPSAEKMPAASSVDEALADLAADKQTAIRAIKMSAAKNLFDRPTTAPWDPTPRPLGQYMLEMIEHMIVHKAQLFYYLKLQGKPVNTMDMYGG